MEPDPWDAWEAAGALSKALRAAAAMALCDSLLSLLWEEHFGFEQMDVIDDGQVEEVGSVRILLGVPR